MEEFTPKRGGGERCIYPRAAPGHQGPAPPAASRISGMSKKETVEALFLCFI